MAKEELIETLKKEGFSVEDIDHVIVLKHPKSQDQIDAFLKRLCQLDYHRSYGYIGFKENPEDPENPISEELPENEESEETMSTAHRLKPTGL